MICLASDLNSFGVYRIEPVGLKVEYDNVQSVDRNGLALFGFRNIVLEDRLGLLARLRIFVYFLNGHFD